MGEVVESVMIDASLAATWDCHFDQRRWASWVEGFAAVESAQGYPEAGGRLTWRSTPAGRGTVAEEVLAHQPRSLHRIAFTDPQSEGELETRFEVRGEQTRVEQRLAYALRRRGPFSWLTDRLFVRPLLRNSIRRSLNRLKREVEDTV